MKKPTFCFSFSKNRPPPLSSAFSVIFCTKNRTKKCTKKDIQNKSLHQHQSIITNQGLTLIEALVAMIIFSIGLLGMIKLLSITSRLQNNMEYQLQANLIASNVREILTASSGRLTPSFIEGVLDNQACNGGAMCNQGKTVRQSFIQQNQNLYGGGDLNLQITHGTIVNNDLVANNNCHDPIFAQITFRTKKLQTAGQSNAQGSDKLITYTHQVGQYRIFNNKPAFWGVSCAV